VKKHESSPILKNGRKTFSTAKREIQEHLTQSNVPVFPVLLYFYLKRAVDAVNGSLSISSEKIGMTHVLK